MSTARGERRLRLAASRSQLYSLPLNELWELPGRPHVVWTIRSYASATNQQEAALQARADLPFLFKAFETGQIGPKRMAKMHGGKPRMATIHEYLDWTLTAQAAQEDDELDFGGFRVVVILPRYVSHWPYPGSLSAKEGKRTHEVLGAPLPPLPLLQSHGRPLSAATIRTGPGYIEIPFVATHEGKRGRGYCRCLLEAIEDICRALSIKQLMLCSTNDPMVKSTWHHLGFDFTSEEQMHDWDIPHSDLVYLQNTTQMHKFVPPRGVYRPIVIKQGDFKMRTYARLDPVPKRPRLHMPPPKKAPPKKAIQHHSTGSQLTMGGAGGGALMSTALSQPLHQQLSQFMNPQLANPHGFVNTLPGPHAGLTGDVAAVAAAVSAATGVPQLGMQPQLASAGSGSAPAASSAGGLLANGLPPVSMMSRDVHAGGAGFGLPPLHTVQPTLSTTDMPSGSCRSNLLLDRSQASGSHMAEDKMSLEEVMSQLLQAPAKGPAPPTLQERQHQQHHHHQQQQQQHLQPQQQQQPQQPMQVKQPQLSLPALSSSLGGLPQLPQLDALQPQLLQQLQQQHTSPQLPQQPHPQPVPQLPQLQHSQLQQQMQQQLQQLAAAGIPDKLQPFTLPGPDKLTQPQAQQQQQPPHSGALPRQMHPHSAPTFKEQQPHLVAQVHSSGPPGAQQPQLPLPGQIQLPPSLQQQMEQQFQLGFGNQPLLLPPNPGLPGRPALPNIGDSGTNHLGIWPQPKGLPPLSQQPQLPSLSNAAGLSQPPQQPQLPNLPNLPNLSNAGLGLPGMGALQPHLFGNGGTHSIQPPLGNLGQGTRPPWSALSLANAHSTGPPVPGGGMPPGLPQLPALPPGIPGLPDLLPGSGPQGLLPPNGITLGKQPGGLQLGQQPLPGGLQLGQQQGGLQLGSQQPGAGGLQLGSQQPQAAGLQLGPQQAPAAGLQLGNQQPQAGVPQTGNQAGGGSQPQPLRHALNLGDGAPAGKLSSQPPSQQPAGLHLSSGNGAGAGVWLGNQPQGPHGVPGMNPGSGTGMSSGSGISGSLNLGGAGGGAGRPQQHHAAPGRPIMTMGLDLGGEEASRKLTTGSGTTQAGAAGT